MARINRTDVIQKAVNDLAISTSTEKVPNETLDKVQLTYDLNKTQSTFVVAASVTASGSASVTVPTASAGSDTFLTGIQASYIKDVTCDSATGAYTVTVVPEISNTTTPIIRFSIITLTAQSDSLYLPLPYPLKIKNNSSISITGTHTAGTAVKSIAVNGFITSSN